MVTASVRTGASRRWSPHDWLGLSRLRDWWSSKLPFIGGVALWLNPHELSAFSVLSIMATIATLAAFGYGLNEVADRASDRRADKINRAVHLSALNWGLFLLVTATACLGLGLFWAPDLAGPGFLLAALAVSTIYSAPPLRLKERGFPGIVAGAAAQWALPVLIVSAAGVRGWLALDTWLLSLLALCIGIRWMSVHQLHDMQGDRKAGVRTYTTQGGAVEKVILGAFLIELGLIAVASLATWPTSIAPITALGLWLLKTFSGSLTGKPLRESLVGDYGSAPLADYYFFLLPVSLAIGRGMHEPGFLALVPVFLFLGIVHIIRIGREWRAI